MQHSPFSLEGLLCWDSHSEQQLRQHAEGKVSTANLATSQTLTQTARQIPHKQLLESQTQQDVPEGHDCYLQDKGHADTFNSLPDRGRDSKVVTAIGAVG